MSQLPGYYESSNNIVIVPTVSFIKNKAMPPQKLDTTTKQVLATENKVQSGVKVLTSNNTNQPNPKPLVINQSQPTSKIEQLISIPKIEQSLKPKKPKTLEKQHTKEICNGDVNKNLANVEDLNKAKKVTSWASNYLQSIGHSNLKPIKINLSTSKNKLQSNKEITSKSNDSRNIPSVPLKVTPTPSCKDINMNTDHTNKKIIGDKTKTNIGHIKSRPTNARGSFVKTSDIHLNKAPAIPGNKNIVSSNIMLDTIYSIDSNNSRAPATPPAKGNGEATLCYKAGNREIDILDAIKSKISLENVQRESRMMNLPTHKDMCEKFIKEINNKSSTSERKKRDHSKAFAKNEEPIRPAKPHAQHGKVKKIDVKHKKLPDDSSKYFRKQITDKNPTKKSKVFSKVEKTEKKFEKYDQHKELQKNKLIDNLKDFDNLKRHAEKETAKHTKAPEKQTLKRTRTISKDNIKHSTIKSVIKVAENCPSNPPKRQRLDESFDLRSKLSRGNQIMSNNTHVHNDSQALNKKIKRENLKICIENKMEKKQNSPKKSGVLKYKKSNCRKLKLIINVVCQESGDDNTSSDSSDNESENNPSHNIDLSFLDDFNVDEIVDSLKHSPKKNIKSPLLLENKMEDNTKNTPELELKLSTILGILHDNKFKTTGETEFKFEDIMINKRPNTENDPTLVPTVHEKEIENSYFNQNNNVTTHDLLKILSQSNMQIDQEKTKLSETCHRITKDVGILDNFYKENKTQSSDGRLIIDESVVINDHKTSITDLTDDTFSRPSLIQSKKKSVNKQAYEKSKINNIAHDSIKHNEKVIDRKFSYQPLRNTEKIKVEPGILNKKEEIIIDLTNRDGDNEKNKLNLDSNKAVVENNYTNFQVAVQNGTIPEFKEFNENLKNKQEYDIHLIPLPNNNIDNTSEETVDMVKVPTVHEKEIENSYFNQNNNVTTHDLLKISSQSNMQIDQEKMKLSETCHRITKDVGILDNFYKENKTQSSDGRLIIDESVVINDHKTSITDLTDDTFSRPSLIQSKKKSVNKQAYEKSKINNIAHDSIKHNEKVIDRKFSYQPLRNTEKIKVEPGILNKNEEIIIDLTNRDGDNEKNKLNLDSNKAVVENNYTNFQVAVQNGTMPEFKEFNENLKNKQEYDIHLIPLPNNNIDNTSEETVDMVKVKTESIKDEQCTKKSHINVRKEKIVDSKSENVQGDSNETINKDYARKQHLKTQLCKMVANEKTQKTHQETNVNIKQKNNKVKENITNVYDSGKAKNIMTTKVNTSKGTKNACQIFETKAVEEIFSSKTNKIQAKNVPEMTPKVNNDSKNKPRITNNKIMDNNKPQGVASKTSNVTKNKPVITPKTKNDCKIKPTTNFKNIDAFKITLGASKTSNDTKKQAEIVPKSNNHTKNKLEMPPKTNDSINKPRTFKTYIDTKKQPEIVSKPNDNTKNEPDMAPKTNYPINLPEQKELGASKTSNDTKKQAEIVPQSNNHTKNKLEIPPKTNDSINKPRTFKTYIDTKKQPEIVSKPNDNTKNEPDMAPKTNNPINIPEQKELEIASNSKEDTKIKPKNTSKTISETKNESAISKSTEKNEETILTGKHKMLTDLLKQRMFDYLHKDIKVIKHIHLGKYSKIFSCKDSSGQTYAAKVLKNQNNRNALGIEKEQMIRKLQQDIPKENRNTVYLIDGFGIERYWCFLTEYYPENLEQALQVNKIGFHIDQVQDLARQLISAVMVLRCNDIVHSDIKPSHILINATHDRIKLCGFDAAYHINNALPLPNIGTIFYRAPEVILGFSAGHSIDVWSSALVIYQMVTNQKLINTFYNNRVLYKQMCIFGNLPWDMLDASCFKNKHFQGRTFIRRVGVRGQDAILYQRFYKTDLLYNYLMRAYNKDWKSTDVYQTVSDNFKLTALHKLLEQMLVLDPRLRLPIEFVSADPFIYQIQPLTRRYL